MIEINMNSSNGLYFECPKCGNEEIELGQNYCQICGEAIEWREE